MFVALIILWLISDILAPFILGAIIAYLLDPIADKFKYYGVPLITALGISILVILIFTVVVLTVLPIILDQTSQLFAIPDVAEEVFLTVQKWFSFLNLEKFNAVTFTEYGDNINEISIF